VNERIRELALQAGINKDAFQFSGTLIKHIVDEPSLEKFAELIVRECADIATMNQFQWDSVGEYVLKHFGVK
jgi:hypothetical protein